MARRKPVTPRKKPTQGRSRFTVQQIVEAAAHVFEKRGYAETTTNHIAAKAGVSIGSLYQYFPNKEAILVVLLEDHLAQGATAFEKIRLHVAQQPHDLPGILRHFVEAMVELHANRPQLQQVLLNEAPRPPHLLEKWNQIEAAAVLSARDLLQSHPQVQVRDAHLAAYLVVQTVESLTHQFVVEPPVNVDQDRFADELVRMLLQYLGGRALAQ